MKQIRYFLFTLLFGFCVLQGPISAYSDDGIKFALLFSANVNGELEPCG